MGITKKDLRQKLLAKRLGLTPREAEDKRTAIFKKIVESSLLAHTKKVSCYIPINNEVDTKPIINFLVEAGVEVYLPKYFEETDEYRLAQFRGWSDLEKGPLGILEPKSGGTIDVGKIDLAFLPGVAFDKKGMRLGYGKGVFDRLFAKSGAKRVGLAYEFQIVDVIPKEIHDLKMDFVVTEERLLDFVDLGSHDEVID